MEKNRIGIDKNLCNGCGSCIFVCPTATISLKEGMAIVSGKDCISCGHCAAACPQAAICVGTIDEDMSRYNTFNAVNQWLPHGKYDITGLVQLMASRRSCRCFTNSPVDQAILEDLVKIGITAPSGTNSQAWTFTVLPTRKAVTSLAEHIVSFFERLNTTAEKTLFRFFLKLIGKGELDAYYRSYYRMVKYAINDWRKSGKDHLFHGSTAAIVIGSKPGASCPAEDALLAAQNILLAAHSMGLSSCLIGYAVSSMRKDSTIQKSIGIPSEEEIYAVIALGYSDEVYQRVTGRKKVSLRYFEG